MTECMLFLQTTEGRITKVHEYIMETGY